MKFFIGRKLGRSRISEGQRKLQRSWGKKISEGLVHFSRRRDKENWRGAEEIKLKGRDEQILGFAGFLFV